ncbi:MULTISPECIES: phosphonate ABC transporter substrate-binding protein [Pandoraea]|jgi:phosphonate transport system substrate-binding protein|uniref:Alkylphosphonate ABC transporter substrate-binding protein n=1 Tax=Pandoraea pnomenusa TaxID=93220 RepID=A0A378YTD2_9BURK|nr:MULTISPECIES: phosphonate ABC transporter substrate-binding protein [Pandoraea]AHB07503.1 alkylphosphonate ABC transporter substrate-binding protein [Pandoraea pnomenusa 3kgm]AHB76306.1 phosphonate ABC transporter substrate-binding protein [Pandoraea pnomenusa]AHN75371.1 phosphonate ABC transporter substrate-binding protein [Pandoraea pnomenusa]AIU28050.1 phosphonate ABC transporter substrate-binding protein [Pandoraea pnomenusa]ANC45189.1 phosphonate ABC transporter substrate-binding prote
MKLWKTLLAGAAMIASVAAAHAQEINFGIISTDSSAALRQRWQPLIDDMEKQTGLKVTPFFATDYAGVIEGMRFNKVQLAWMGNKGAMEAVDRSQGEVFAKIQYADGTEGYYSLLISNASSPYKTLDDVIRNGKKINFGLGDPTSTSGTLVPGYYVFAKNNIDPRTYFKTARSSNHGANLMAVINNQVDVATNNTEELNKLEATQPEKAKLVHVIWKSPLIPSDPLLWRKDLPDATKKKIRDFFLAYGKDAHEKEVLKNIYNYGGFRASSDAQLLPIRQLELFKQRTQLEADTSVDAAKKKAQLADIDSKLAALDQQIAKTK